MSSAQQLATATVADALAALQTSAAGLSDTEAAARRRRYGPNRLQGSAAPPAWRIFVEQFRSVLVGLLAAGAVMAAAVGHLTDAIAIVSVVILNAGLGFLQEWRAERALEALHAMLPSEVHVRRGGVVVSCPADALVPGDIVLLEAGDAIPADGRLLEARELAVDQAALTGESQAVTKRVESRDNATSDTPLHSLEPLVFGGTTVARGRCEMIVFATGNATRMGQVAGLVRREKRKRTPLQRQLDSLGRRLGIGTIGVIVAIVLLQLVLSHLPWLDVVLAGISLAVAGIPEGLPAVVTVTLALGMRRMAHHQAIVRRLGSVETLGSTDIICTDKTGTLTQNRMDVHALHAAGTTRRIDGPLATADIPASGPLPRLLRALVLCNNAATGETPRGDPLEQALLRLVPGPWCKRVQRLWTRRAELPFDAARRMMATFHTPAEGADDNPAAAPCPHLVCVKGAPGPLLERCSLQATDTRDEPLDAAGRQALQAVNTAMADDALRVLAVAERCRHKAAPEASDGTLTGLTFLGFVGLLDGPRPDVHAALAQCRDAGIRVMMLTGDQPATAGAIGRMLGFAGAPVAGTELDALSDAALPDALAHTDVVARVLPEHKYRIVKGLQAGHHVVAMTGDGVNDAPALKAADIGVAMGRDGTAVARAAADVVLTDDNFTTIVTAVREGRAILDNIIRFVRFQVSTNVGAVLTVFVAALLGLGLPLGAVQLLWINVIMDGPPAMALGIEPPHPNIMGRPPRDSRKPLLDRGGALLLASRGAVMAAATLTVFVTTPGDAGRALTASFTTFVLLQLANLLSVRSQRHSILSRQSLSNWQLWLALAMVLLLHLAIVYVPALDTTFHTTPLPLVDWGRCAGAACSLVIFDELRKLVARRLRRRHHNRAVRETGHMHSL